MNAEPVTTEAPVTTEHAPQHSARIDAVDVLMRSVADNRFLPQPPSERCDSGDGDFRAVGAEFLGHAVKLGGLRPGHDMVDVGCGIGRLAVPLTQYLDPVCGRYLGVDVSADAIHWCHEHITQVYPNFQFRHLDLCHPIYNAAGRLAGADTALPLHDASADFACMVSVVTHLLEAQVAANAKEIARVLRLSGRCLVSAFVINEYSEAALRSKQVARLPFQLDAEGSPYFVDAQSRTAAVAYDEHHLMRLFASAGLALADAPVYGHWSGRDAAPFQDLFVFVRNEHGVEADVQGRS